MIVYDPITHWVPQVSLLRPGCVLVHTVTVLWGNALDEFPKRHDNKMGLVRTHGQSLQPDQVMLISAAVSAGMKQVVCVPAGVSVPGTAGKKVPSGFTVAP